MYGKENSVICQCGYKRSLWMSWRGQCEKNICGGGSDGLLHDSLSQAVDRTWWLCSPSVVNSISWRSCTVNVATIALH